MRYAPTIPPYPVGVAEGEEPHAVSALRPSRPVGPRTLPPLILQRPVPGRRGDGLEAQPGERREEEVERRQVCRRVTYTPLPLDTRSGHDRRHEARRRQDHLDASVDIKA